MAGDEGTAPGYGAGFDPQPGGRPLGSGAVIGDDLRTGDIESMPLRTLYRGFRAYNGFVAEPAAVNPANDSGPVVLYDGYCGLCDRSVRWLVDADRRAVLRYAPLQGETAAPILERHGIPAGGDFDSFILVENLGSAGERLRQRSDGALAALVALGGWRAGLARVGRIVPRAIRDAVYDFVARRRTRWFGRLNACRLPTPEERHRFLP